MYRFHWCSFLWYILTTILNRDLILLVRNLWRVAISGARILQKCQFLGPEIVKKDLHFILAPEIAKKVWKTFMLWCQITVYHASILFQYSLNWLIDSSLPRNNYRARLSARKLNLHKRNFNHMSLVIFFFEYSLHHYFILENWPV